MEPDLQVYIDKYACRYFIENDTKEGEVLNFALRSTFVRLYALNRNARSVEAHKTRFQYNDRVQIFTWTHQDSWDELVRLIPVEQPSVFWLHSSELLSDAIHSISRLRPMHRDILFVDPGLQRGAALAIKRFFGGTHCVSEEYAPLLLLKPEKLGR